MPKDLIFNTNDTQSVRDKIRSGVNVLANAIKITLGPTGKVVMYERDFGDPVITKDGVTVAKQVELEDHFENMAVAIVRQAASMTAATAGDGTTTATIYAQAIYEAGIKSVVAGANAQEIKRGIERAVSLIVDSLAEAAKAVVDIDQIKQVAICSSNQDEEIGECVADAMDRVGKDGVITIEEGSTLETTVNVVDGLQFPRGYMSQQFATNPETLDCEYEDALILVANQKVGDLQTLFKILEIYVKECGKVPLVVIADEFSEECINAMVLNRIRNQIQIVAVQAPGFGDRRRDTLDDIAIAVGATLLSKGGQASFDVFGVKCFGVCKKIVINRDSTTILQGGGASEAMEERTQLLRTQLDKMVGNFDKERTQERLARLTGGIAQISVGGATEVEVREKKDRIEDALHACKAATSEGVLPGGGVAVLHNAKKIMPVCPSPDFKIGVDIIMKAIQAPLRQIAINTGIDDGVVVDKVMSSDDDNFGYDAALNKYGNMVEFGIIVPAKVERAALQNAASVAGLLLTTDCMIAIKKNTTPEAPPMFPSLGGM